MSPPRAPAASSLRAPRTPAVVHAREVIPLREGALRIVVVADTHSHPHAALDARLAATAPDRILHAGDIGDLAVLSALARHAPVTAVRGNIDGRSGELPDVVTLELRGAETTALKILLLHIAIDRTRLRSDIARLAASEGAPLVVCGHSHVPFARTERGVTVFNPGSVGPRRFHLPIVFGVIEVAPGGVSLYHLDCETGLRWRP